MKQLIQANANTPAIQYFFSLSFARQQCAGVKPLPVFICLFGGRRAGVIGCGEEGAAPSLWQNYIRQTLALSISCADDGRIALEFCCRGPNESWRLGRQRR